MVINSVSNLCHIVLGITQAYIPYHKYSLVLGSALTGDPYFAYDIALAIRLPGVIYLGISRARIAYPTSNNNNNQLISFNHCVQTLKKGKGLWVFIKLSSICLRI